MYRDSKDKREVLDRYRYEEGSVIIGPSLFDGLSFDDDLCRFLIIAKVPYPDMKNNFIKKKMEKDYDWYAGQASLSIIQGVGRGVRSESDWCYSFILDGSFSMLARNYGGMYSPQFRSRVIMIDENLQIRK
jgi:Rad3-related DNA helicase